MKVSRISLIMAVLFLISTSALIASSLWTPASTRGMYADLRPSRVGDLITVLIVEESSSSIKATEGYGKSLNHGNAAGVGPFLSFIPDMSYNSQQSSSTSGETTSSNRFATRLAAKVTNVMPNGTLQIEALRSIDLNGEKQEIKLTGTVRPQDISANNIVLSTSLADVNLETAGTGAIGDRQKEGIISRLLKFLF